jgi:signal transduction histidine kinase
VKKHKMKIRTQFIIAVIMFAVLLAAISASAIYTGQKVESASAQETIAANIAQGANELSYLANDYVIYQENQQLERWQTRFSSFSKDVASLKVSDPEQQALASNIQANAQRMNDVFASVVSAFVNQSSDIGAVGSQSSFQVSWSRLSVQSQSLVSDASRLSGLLDADASQYQRFNSIFIIALISVFVAYFLFNYLMTQRRALQGLAKLQAGANVIGSGNLNYKIDEKGKDEIGDLSRSFNRMTVDLKEVTASKVELEREAEERQRAEEELRRTNAELEASNKELEAFSYSVSHDLRAPLRSMDGFSGALIEDYADKLDEKGKQYLKYVQESSETMARLIDDLLKLSRVTRSEMSYQTVNLSELAGKIVAELQRSEPERKVEVNIAPDIMANGDANLLRLALENLLNNAWKFSGKSSSARIEMGITDHNAKETYFVRDNGAGFDMKYADKLFKPFQRLHRDSEFPGTGVGLASVQRIIHRHGGEVWAESSIGKGATFYFTLR